MSFIGKPAYGMKQAKLTSTALLNKPSTIRLQNLKKSKQSKRDPFCIENDKIIKDAEKRILEINREHTKLSEKIGARARILLKKSAIEIISNQKWLIHGVDLYRKDESRFLLSLSAAYDDDEVARSPGILSSQLDRYNVGQFIIDDICLSLNYDTMTISASGANCQELVFELVKKLKLKIDYVSYLKTTEYAESEIAARKKLIDDLSSTVLFEI